MNDLKYIIYIKHHQVNIQRDYHLIQILNLNLNESFQVTLFFLINHLIYIQPLLLFYAF